MLIERHITAAQEACRFPPKRHSSRLPVLFPAGHPYTCHREKAHPRRAGRQGDGAMQEHIRERVLTLSNYIIESGATVRQTANKYGVSKSAVPYIWPR